METSQLIKEEEEHENALRSTLGKLHEKKQELYELSLKREGNTYNFKKQKDAIERQRLTIKTLGQENNKLKQRINELQCGGAGMLDKAINYLRSY